MALPLPIRVPLRAFIEPTEQPPNLFAVRPMNFSQPVAGLDALRYRLVANAPLTWTMFAPVFAQFMAEDQADRYLPGEFPDLDQLQALGYPALPDLAAHHPALCGQVLLRWFAQDLLNALIYPHYHDATAAFHYVVNTLEALTLTDETLTLDGVAYKSARAPQRNE